MFYLSECASVYIIGLEPCGGFKKMQSFWPSWYLTLTQMSMVTAN